MIIIGSLIIAPCSSTPSHTSGFGEQLPYQLKRLTLTKLRQSILADLWLDGTGQIKPMAEKLM